MGFALSSFRKALPALTLVLAYGSTSAAVYNFDMTMLTPGPAFDAVELSYQIDPASGVGCAVYGGFDLSGGYVSGCAGTGTVDNMFTQPAMLDGIFSINLASFGDEYSFSNLFAVGYRDGVRTAPLVLIPAIEEVPEPATAALVALSLAGMALLRRRKP